MAKEKLEPPRGILNRSPTSSQFSLARFEPSIELSYFIEHYWIVRWNLIGKAPYKQDVLAHPSVHLVFEKNNTWIWGVVSGKFTRKLEGEGLVLGVKFHPGGFYPFYKKSVDSFKDSKLPFSAVFPDDLAEQEETISSNKEDQAMVAGAERFLHKYLPNKDPRVQEVNTIIALINNSPNILKVDDLLHEIDFSKRTLQRLFKQYVGVSPKWVIQRYRLHEVAEKMAAGQVDNWPALAIDAGYFDQAHFIRDFKAIVGQTPKQYAEKLTLEG